MVFQGKAPFIVTVLICSAAALLQITFATLNCSLCIYEQNVFQILVFMGIFYILLPNRQWKLGFIEFQEFDRVKWAGFLIFSVICFVGFALSSYHVLIQQGILPVPSFCEVPSFSLPSDVTGKQLDEMLREMSEAYPTPCDKYNWTLFGLSFAEYAVLTFGGLTIYNFIAYRQS